MHAFIIKNTATLYKERYTIEEKNKGDLEGWEICVSPLQDYS